MSKGLVCTTESAGRLSIQVYDPHPKSIKSGSQALALIFSESLSGSSNLWGWEGVLGGSDSKESARFHHWIEKIRWRREWQPTPVLLPRELHGQRNLVGYSS